MIRPLLAIDIESGGCQPSKHPLIAIGTCLFKPCGSKEKKIFRFNFDYAKFEPKCVEEFWSKHQDKLDKLKQLPISSIADFANYVDDLDKQFDNLTILSDNPSYDISFINYVYDVELNRKPILYKYNNKYRIVIDPNSYFWALMPETDDPWISDSKVLNKFKVEINSVHDHMPDNDAEHILDTFVQILKVNINKT